MRQELPNSQIEMEGKLRLNEALARVISSTVGIEIFYSDKERPGGGTGVHIGNGLVLTAQHILVGESDAPEKIIISQDYMEYYASVEKVVEGLDLLLLRIHDFENGLQAVDIYNEENYHESLDNQRLFYSSYFPKRLVSECYFLGMVEKTKLRDVSLLLPSFIRFPKNMQYAFAMATIGHLSPGNSGSGIFTIDGKLAGIMELGVDTVNCGFAISTSALKELR